MKDTAPPPKQAWFLTEVLWVHALQLWLRCFKRCPKCGQMRPLFTFEDESTYHKNCEPCRLEDDAARLTGAAVARERRLLPTGDEPGAAVVPHFVRFPVR